MNRCIVIAGCCAEMPSIFTLPLETTDKASKDVYVTENLLCFRWPEHGIDSNVTAKSSTYCLEQCVYGKHWLLRHKLTEIKCFMMTAMLSSDVSASRFFWQQITQTTHPHPHIHNSSKETLKKKSKATWGTGQSILLQELLYWRT